MIQKTKYLIAQDELLKQQKKAEGARRQETLYKEV